MMDIRCSCGCGGVVAIGHGGRPNRFLHGHNRMGIKRGPMPDDVRRKISVTKEGWTDKETALLIEHYPLLYPDELMMLIPRHSIAAIYVKARHLGISKSGDPTLSKSEKLRRALKGRRTGTRNSNSTWTDAEVQLLTDRYKELTSTELSRLMPHNAAAIRTKAQKLGVRKGTKTADPNSSYSKLIAKYPSILTKNRDIQRRRRARLKGAYIEHVDFNVIWDRDGGVCGICGEPVAIEHLSFDHIIPIPLGGDHTESNLRVAQRRCNSKRGNRV